MTDPTPAGPRQGTTLPGEALWTNRQLMIEAEVIVVGRYGASAVYNVLKQLRDDMQSQIDKLEAHITELEITCQSLADGLVIDEWDEPRLIFLPDEDDDDDEGGESE